MYFRTRYYDPATGEFMSCDPLEYVDGMSLYRGYFVPKGMDPEGTSCSWSYCEGVGYWGVAERVPGSTWYGNYLSRWRCKFTVSSINRKCASGCQCPLNIGDTFYAAATPLGIVGIITCSPVAFTQSWCSEADGSYDGWCTQPWESGYED